MDSLLFLCACGGLAWVIAWALRDWSKPSQGFWPFDAKWMKRDRPPTPQTWQRKPSGGGRG